MWSIAKEETRGLAHNVQTRVSYFLGQAADAAYKRKVFLILEEQICSITNEDPLGTVQIVQPEGSYFLGQAADAGLIGQNQYIKSGQSIDFLIFALFALEMDKKFAQNVGIAPSSDTATTGVNSDIFALTAVVIPYYLQPAVRPRPRIYMRSMSRASKLYPKQPSDTVFQ